MRFSVVTDYFEKLEQTSSRLEMTDLLVELFQKTPADESGKVAYLCLGHLDAEYRDLVLGIGDKMMVRALAIASHRMPEEINKRFKKVGDFGLLAEEIIGAGKGFSLAAFSDVEKKPLELSEIFISFQKVASYSGSKSQDLKIKTIAGLLSRASPIEAKYIARLAVETMRLGTGAMTLLDALSVAYTKDKANRPVIESAYNISSDIGLVADELSEGGLERVRKIKPAVGRPIKMMAAQRVKELKDIAEKMDRFAVEEKYDGERMQIHKDGDSVRIFSRRLDEISYQYPDIIDMIVEGVSAKKAIFEGEAVAIREGHLMSFQTLMQRKRKYDIDIYIKKIPVRLFLFDLLLLDDEDYMQKHYETRRGRLEEIVRESENLTFARRIITGDLKKVEEFFEEGLSRGTEGIMAKSMSEGSIYRAGAREWLWIKWKKDYLEGLVDTFDLVLIGAIYGTGKRAGKYGTLLGATYNPEKDVFESFCKIGTGFTDENLDSMKKNFESLLSKEKPARVVSELEADVWFEPGIVMEVSGAEITESPLHSCAKDELGKGLSLRFPRFKRYRDKKAEDATSTGEVLSMYEG